jgi:2-dehydropantoate 2-reductase
MNATIGQVQANRDSWSVALSCAREADAVARAKKINLGFDDVESYVRDFGANMPEARPSMLLDHMAQRPSEIDGINGAVPVEAEKIGMSAPINALVSGLIRGREANF